MTSPMAIRGRSANCWRLRREHDAVVRSRSGPLCGQLWICYRRKEGFISMHNRREAKPDGVRIFLWRGTVPALLALLVMAPLLFVFLSVAAMLVAGGVLGALVLPWF